MGKKIGSFILLLSCILLIATGCGNISKEISLGSWNEDTYTNEFLGLTYSKPADWVRYTDEQIKDVMQLGQDLVDASEISKKLAELTSVTYLMSSSPNGSNVILMSEKPVVSMSVESYADSLKSQLESQTALTYTLSDVKKETIDGKEFTTIEASVETINQKYYIYKVDKYIVSLIVTATEGNNVNDIISQFKFN